jgi:hypothetical protein
VKKLQEQIQELAEQTDKLHQEIIFNQSVITELYKEEESESSELLSKDNTSIEVIPSIKVEAKAKTKKETAKKTSEKKEER